MFCQELTLQGIFNSTEFLDWGLRQTSLLALLSLGFSGSSGIILFAVLSLTVHVRITSCALALNAHVYL